MVQRLIELFLLFHLAHGTGYLALSAFGKKSSLSESTITGLVLLALFIYITAFFLPVPQWIVFFASVGSLLLYISKGYRKSILQYPLMGLLTAWFFCAFIADFKSQIPDEFLYHRPTMIILQLKGWMAGIGNLEPRFAMGSIFHVLEASWPHFNDRIMPLNGLMVFLLFLRLFESAGLSKVFSLTSIIVLSPFIALMTSSSSVDLAATIVLVWLIEDIWISNKFGSTQLLLMAFAVLLKSQISYLIFVLYLITVFSNRGIKAREMAVLIGSFTLLFLKNIYLSGILFFPANWGRLSLPWTIPTEAYEKALGLLRDGQSISAEQVTGIVDWVRKMPIEAFLLFISAIAILILAFLSSRKQLYRKLLILVVAFLPLWWMLNDLPNFRLGMPIFLSVLVVVSYQKLAILNDRILRVMMVSSLLLSAVLVRTNIFFKPVQDSERQLYMTRYDDSSDRKIQQIMQLKHFDLYPNWTPE